ncbi:sensor histidine kinase [Chitinimonas sp. BJYL2]|uniref:sensor histidine kinase n=1 Tax=Chitinimonas sp. BJYL2 TaxID=2976696 RepID=UPI0022B5DD66|nr:histidine kinase [Chitinimonas sp. BJYL2]
MNDEYTPQPGKGSMQNSKNSASRESWIQLKNLLVQFWWQFFDWLAIVPWKTLAIVAVLVFILAGMLNAEQLGLMLVVASIIIKVVAGGKLRAEVQAERATARAETEKMEKVVIEARMEALQAQIEPHFLFNTLASVEQLILTDPPRAAKMQQSLIRYLRSAMPQMREGSRPTLGQQTSLSTAFLEIMQVRMEERLQTDIRVPDGLKSAVFPSMMLQTLVENAIKHGLEPKAEGGKLTIAAEIVDGALEVSVTDTGIGFGNSHASSGGVGLANIRERLKGLYGGHGELIIMIPTEGGTRATIRIPYEVTKPATAA